MRSKFPLFIAFCFCVHLSAAQEDIDKLPGAPLESERTLAWIYDKIRGMAEADDLSASVLIQSGNATLFSYACGKHAHLDSTHNTGYNSLMMPAIAIAKLQDMDMLKIDDLLRKHHPEFSANDTLIISDILNQGSGFVLEENFRIAYELIENAAGQTYPNFIQKNIFQVCGMTSSKFVEVEQQDSQNAVDKCRSFTANVSELSRFHRILSAGALITIESKQQLVTDTVSNNENWNIKHGLGFDHYKVMDNEAIIVNGKSETTNFDYYHFPQSNRTLIMFVDSNKEAYKRIKKILLSLLVNN